MRVILGLVFVVQGYCAHLCGEGVEGTRKVPPVAEGIPLTLESGDECDTTQRSRKKLTSPDPTKVEPVMEMPFSGQKRPEPLGANLGHACLLIIRTTKKSLAQQPVRP